MDFSSGSKLRLVVVSLIVVLLVMLFGVALDSYLVKKGVRRADVLITADGLTGIVAGLLFYSLGDNQRRRQREMEERLRVIADLNHHIRNALQVITYATAQNRQVDSMTFVRESVDRITWALREVLPEYQPSSANGAAAPKQNGAATPAKQDEPSQVGN